MRTLVALLALAVPLAAQAEPKSFPRVDPYTKNDPGLIQKAGYVSFGPFRFGDDHTSLEATQTLGGIPLLWVETEHFKLGSALGEYTLGDDYEKRRVQGELERLALRLPDVKAKTKKLDPWLRLHLYALRLEELYGQFLGAFHLREEEFPSAPPDPKKPPANFMGRGHYLGMSAKFTVLLLERKASAARYGRVYLGHELDAPTQHLFATSDSFLFLTASEFLVGENASDTGLACAVVGGVAQNLALGFRGPEVGLCFAVREGIAHWFAQRVDPRYHLLAGGAAEPRISAAEGGWAPPVRARVEHRVFPSTNDMLAWNPSTPLEWADHLILWSRLDCLLAREDGAAGNFLRQLKAPLAEGASAPTADELVERARAALPAATGGDLEHFDQEWSAWVLKTYPSK
ncbi:MAG: hypothetical protein EXS08_04395 [Planctomycetes bacterium]|nr:hypothetical protein [Planctomycetota bacterium]